MATLACGDRSLTIDDGPEYHYVWLRDNCWCDECRVPQTGERRVFTADIPAAIAPQRAELDEAGTLVVEWNDGHASSYSRRWLGRYDYGDAARAARRHRPVLWDAGLALARFDHGDVVGSKEGQLAYLDALRDYGVALVAGTPAVAGEVERFAAAVGHLREVAFERVHNVYHDPAGYNVAHTPIELKPHTDFPSYTWPPSVQLLHFLVNDAAGGESIVVDGWRVLADLRAAEPGAFHVLTRVPVAFQMFSSGEDTWAEAPVVELDARGEVRTLRFSNQLAQPLDAPGDMVEPFYDAYRMLGRMVDDPAYRKEFRTTGGDLVTVHGHRVLHGRKAFDPASGARHLQDGYMEWDDLMARRRVLLGGHEPLPAQP